MPSDHKQFCRSHFRLTFLVTEFHPTISLEVLMVFFSRWIVNVFKLFSFCSLIHHFPLISAASLICVTFGLGGHHDLSKRKLRHISAHHVEQSSDGWTLGCTSRNFQDKVPAS